MTTKDTKTFHVFRYQLLPLSNVMQLSILDNISDIEELKAKKNDIFFKELSAIKKFSYSRSEIIHKFFSLEKDFIIIKIGHQKIINVNDRNFQKEEVEDWTPILIIINNEPDVQKIFIEFNRKVFTNSETIARILEENLNNFLKQYNLGVYLEPLFDEKEFWNTVEKYPSSIIQVGFDLVSPNMANISKALTLDLSQLKYETNTHKTKVELNSAKDGNLNIERDNEFIGGLVEYASQGGGDIAVKIQGLHKKIKMSKSVLEIELDSISIEGDDPESIKSLLRDILR